MAIEQRIKVLGIPVPFTGKTVEPGTKHPLGQRGTLFIDGKETEYARKVLEVVTHNSIKVHDVVDAGLFDIPETSEYSTPDSINKLKLKNDGVIFKRTYRAK